ncbi:MAG: ATP-dependent ligase [Frankiales bacterium]|nr:ATP-dependent ligase [Frankiales bacterium]
MLFADIAAASAEVAATRSRTAKAERFAELLRAATGAEVAVVASYVSGELRQRRTGVGWRSLQDLPDPSEAPTLTVLEVDSAFEGMSSLAGTGSQASRAAAVGALWARATAAEQQLLAGLVSGELRQGASQGVLADAVARAARVPLAAVNRALTLCGSLPEVALAALTGRPLEEFGLEVGRGLSPMLAASAADLEEGWAKVSVPGPVVVDAKLDGIRIQVHRHGEHVRVLTRSLDDITARVPELVEAARGLPAQAFVLDGEALALGGDGRAAAFQDTASQALSGSGSGLVPWYFDLLHLDGVDFLDVPLTTRMDAMAFVPPEQRAPQLVTRDLDEARAFQQSALAAGHEGVVLKAGTSVYAAGRRGATWVKVKPRHTLDLVVLAVEHGHGRRRGWLSNLHLGARHEGGFMMLGKTFKGLTDELLRWQTERFRELEVSDDGQVVTVRPEQVVEVAFDGVQTSPRYPGGVALRFARVIRYREDKRAEDADTLDTVLALRP